MCGIYGISMILYWVLLYHEICCHNPSPTLIGIIDTNHRLIFLNKIFLNIKCKNKYRYCHCGSKPRYFTFFSSLVSSVQFNSIQFCLLFLSADALATAVNLLGPSDAIWWQKSGSTLAQVMACCLTAPSHYLNQCWLIISEAKWHSNKGDSTSDPSNTYH